MERFLSTLLDAPGSIFADDGVMLLGLWRLGVVEDHDVQRSAATEGQAGQGEEPEGDPGGRLLSPV